MNAPRIRLTHAYGEVYPNVFSDFEWVRENRKQLLEVYGECVLLVFEKNVVGMGQTLDEAAEDAERRLSPHISEITPITEFLHHRHPILRVIPESD